MSGISVKAPTNFSTGQSLLANIGPPATKAKINFDTDKEFQKAKGNLAKTGWTVFGATSLGLILGALKFGASFPSKALGLMGDACGSLAAIGMPFFHIKNEIDNYAFLQTSDENKKQDDSKSKNRKFFDDFKTAFYRMCALGFTPYTFKTFLDPENWKKSAWHKLANIVNLPTLAFVGWGYGIGSANALLAWSFRKKEEMKLDKLNKNLGEGASSELNKQVELTNARINAFEQKFDAQKRLSTIGSIAISSMHGLKQWADAMSYVTGSTTTEEFFRNPALGLCRFVNLGIGPFEVLAKDYDSFIRVIDEFDHLEPTLPKVLSPTIKNWSKWFKTKIKEKDNFLKSTRYGAEIIFHTLNPLSIASFVAPLCGTEHLDEEAQAAGGLRASFDKVIGRVGKVFTWLGSGSYVLLGRLPQTVAQIAYFSRWIYGQKILGETKKQTEDALATQREGICKFVKPMSNAAKSIINKWLPGFYEGKQECSYLSYEEVQAHEVFDQAKERFKNFLSKDLTPEKREEIVLFCLNSAKERAQESYYNLDEIEIKTIEALINKKLDQEIGLAPKRTNADKVKLPFVGSNYLVEEFVRLFDMESRIRAMNIKTPHHRMLTAYTNDEVGISFKGELRVVENECFMGGLRRFGNFLLKVGSGDFSLAA